MPTFTPTKELGAAAKLHDVVYSEPDRTVTDEVLASRLAVEGVNTAFVADLLSAFLTHERCGVHLYKSVAGRTNNPVLQAKYEEFGRETQRHVDILEQLIASTGGNPFYVSPLARAVEGADSHALMSTYLGSGGLDPMAAEMAMLDVVFMAETIDHANWETLGRLAEAMPEGPAREAVEAAVFAVEPDEDDHLTWARDTRARLTMLQASGTMMAKAGAKVEELVAQVKGWLGDGASTEPLASPRPPASKGAPTTPTSGTRASSTKASSTKASSKQPSSTKAAAKKAAAKNTATKKAPAKKAAATKTATTKTAAKKAPAKNAAAKKAAATKTAAKKAAATKTATKKTAAKKTSAKKTATTKKATATKKASAKRAARR